jgi:hypothetical protein
MYEQQVRHEARNQQIHENRQQLDPDHDKVSCWCCCFDCEADLVWHHGGGGSGNDPR